MPFWDRPPKPDAPPFFFTHTRVAATETEVLLDLVRPGVLEAEAELLRVVLMRPLMAKYVGPLERQVRAFEAKFSHIRVTRTPAPEARASSQFYANTVKSYFSDQEFFFDFRCRLALSGRADHFGRRIAICPPGAMPPLLSALTAALTSQAARLAP